MHTKFFYPLLLILASCSLPEDNKVEAVIRQTDTANLESTDQYTATADSMMLQPLPEAPRVRRPKGIYQTTLPLDGGMEQTIAFYNNNTYRLQETYTGKKDSIVITEGSWSPSDGFIWLYKDQVVRGRYSWNGDTLQYASPFYKKNFSMRSLQDALDNPGWRNKEQQGVVLYGTGIEPFWNLTFNNKDSISFALSDWDQPVQLKLSSSQRSRDSIAYTARNDSSELKITVYPQFCIDGMSDVVYRNRIRVEYHNQVYHGCGVLFGKN